MSPNFSSPPDPIYFNLLVWELVRQVPPGKVATYGQIARLMPVPPGLTAQDFQAFAPRWVGGAMAACPENVPWQRVINSEGKISARRAGGETIQQQMLLEEGIEFDARGRVDLKRFQWAGPQASHP